MELSGIMMLALLSFVIIFCVCEFFERTTQHFDIVDDSFYQCDWYSFPNDMQHMLVIVIANAHQPIMIRGFGNTLCVRDSVKKVYQTIALFVPRTCTHLSK